MPRFLTAVAVAVALAGLAPIARAQTAIPVEALAAEGRGAWDEALRLHHDLLAREPNRADIWLRVADIHARLGQRERVIDALINAIRSRRDDPGLYARLSSAYAAADQPAAALKAMQAALALAPDDLSYLKAAGELGAWSGDYGSARAALERRARLAPGDPEPTLALARVSAWDGATDRAVRTYRQYLEVAPGDNQAWIEAARAESWRGNDAGAVSLLDLHRLRFGESDEWRLEVASVLARARRPRHALRALRPLLASDAADYEVNRLHALAQIENGNQAAAVRAIRAADLIDPERRETRDLWRQLRNAFGSWVQPAGTGYGDSDGLRSYRVPLSASLSVSSSLRVLGGYERHELRARFGSGLERADGGAAAALDRAWAGVELRPWPPVTVRGQAGRQDAGPLKEWTYAAGIGLRPSDEFRVEYDREHALLAISPRTVSLGLVRDADRIRLAWSPSLVFVVDLDSSREVISDGNDRVAARVSPRVAVVRNQWLNLDLGASAFVFRAAHDLDHGYYDPSRYQAYTVTVMPYVKFSENTGLSVFAEAGVQRDETIGSFEPGGSAAAELTVGLYRAWTLKFTGSATMNARLESGAFRGISGGVALAKKF